MKSAQYAIQGLVLVAVSACGEPCFENEEASGLYGYDPCMWACLNDPPPGPNDFYITSGDGSSELAGLTEVDGYVLFCDNPDLKDLSALANITRIDGNLVIDGNPNLVSPAGLENLQWVGDSLLVTGNLKLTEFRSANSLEYVGRDLVVIGQRDVLETLELPDTLAEIGARGPPGEPIRLLVARVSGSIDLPSGPLRANWLELVNNEAATIMGLEGLYEIDQILIHSNSHFEVLPTFSSLTHVEDLDIRDNHNLTSVVGLNVLESAERVVIVNNASLPTCRVEELIEGIGEENIDSIAVEGNDDNATCE
ncbi:hypothetical protein ACFL6C_02640 [Myxococcota bacterium]